MRGKVSADQCHRGTEEDAASYAGSYALCKEEMPELCGKTCHENPKDLNDHAEDEGRQEETSVKRPSGKGPKKEQEKDLS